MTHPLPEPFFVVATQNPHEQLGTFGLPESQLDRFLMRVSLGYPDRDAERALLLAGERHELLEATAAVLNPQELLAAQRAVRAIYVSAPLLDYVQALVAQVALDVPLGLSPRAAQGLVRAAQGWALLAEERAVLPEHVQAVLPSVAAHRLEQRDGGAARRRWRKTGRRAARRRAGAGLGNRRVRRAATPFVRAHRALGAQAPGRRHAAARRCGRGACTSCRRAPATPSPCCCS